MTQGFFMWTAKALFRLGGCPGWSESLLGAHVILLGLLCCGSFDSLATNPCEPGYEKMCLIPYVNNKGASAQSDQCLCCSLPRQNDTSSLYIRNFKILAGLCSWAGRFVSFLVGDSQRHIFSWRGPFSHWYCHCLGIVPIIRNIIKMSQLFCIIQLLPFREKAAYFSRFCRPDMMEILLKMA